MMRKQILVVDDMPDWRGLLEDILNREYEVKTVDSYEAALEIVRKQEAELVIVDLRLSPTDETDRRGMELLERLAEVKINAIVLTGYPEDDIQQECEEKYKVFDFIDKGKMAGNMQLIRKVVQKAFSLLENNEREKSKIIQEARSGAPVIFDEKTQSAWPLRKFLKDK
jgi:DNA-binding NtrC family response regulator